MTPEEIQSTFHQAISDSGETPYRIAHMWGAENDKMFRTNQSTLSAWINQGLPAAIGQFAMLLDAIGWELKIEKKKKDS